MRSLLWVLLVLVALLQYELWFAEGGIASYWQLQEQIKQSNAINQQWAKHNALLIANIQDLKKGNSALEEQAREQLGMVKPGEVFYQIQPASS